MIVGIPTFMGKIYMYFILSRVEHEKEIYNLRSRFSHDQSHAKDKRFPSLSSKETQFSGSFGPLETPESTDLLR